MRRLIGLAVGAAAGAAVGYSQILCVGGQCAAVGSWYGGAILGGVLGLIIAGGCPVCCSTGGGSDACETPTKPPPEQG